MLEYLLIALNDCVWAFDLNEQRYLFVSPSLHTVTGYTPHDFHGNIKFWDEITDPRDREQPTDTKPGPDGWAERTYRITAPGGKTKWIHQKKQLFTDPSTGHDIILSIINDASAQNIQAERDSRNNEKFLMSLIDSQTNFLIRIDAKGFYTFANRQFLKTFGYKSSEIIGHHFSILTLPEETELCENAFVTCMNNPGKIVHLQHKKPDKAGNIHYTKWEFIAIADDKGMVSEIQGIGQDLTQSIAIEKEIKLADKRLDNFIESITDSFFIINRDWRIIKVNTAFEKVCDMTREKIIGQVIWELFPSIINTGFEKAYRLAMTHQESQEFTEYFEPLNMWFNTIVYPSADGLTVFVRDITHEKHAQEEITWTKNNLEGLINNTEDFIWSIDKDGRYVYMNTGYKKRILATTGIIPQEGDDAYLHSGSTEEINEEWKSYYKRALLGERYEIRHESFELNSTELSNFEVSFNPIYKSKNEVIGVGCFARDITERLKTEKALIEQNERLRNIASLSSHELRRPVASMLGLINIIDRKNFNNPENEQVIEHLHTVSNEIDEVIRLIVNKTFIDILPGKSGL